MQLGTLTVIRAVADDMYAEYLKYFCDRILPLLSMGFTGMLVHGILPNAMISVILVPIIKDKTGKIKSKDNYRVIALVSIMSKIKKKILLNRMDEFLSTNNNQFGLKKKHGTDMCIYVLTEVIAKYQALKQLLVFVFS